MKKIALLVLALLLAAALPLTGCELLEEPFPAETEIDSSILIDPSKTEPEETLSPEDQALTEIAAKALWSQRDYLPEREHFAVDIRSHATNGSHTVEFTLYIGGYRTNEDYSVRISAEGEVTEIDGGYHNYRQFLNGATAERIAAAEAGLDGQIAHYSDKHSGYYLTIDKEGYLCLSCEVIVQLSGGGDGDGGCGIDHDHKFFSERICAPS